MKSLRFPGRFCVGSDMLKHTADLVSGYGKKILFIGGRRALEASRSELEEGFAQSSCLCGFVTCGKIATVSEIERIMRLDTVKGADVLCAVGGGACMDITRTAANRLGKSLVMIPTTAASDAPCSFVSVFYAEDGQKVVGDQIFHKCPDMVLVDSGIIAQAPARHLAAGIADALATFYEAHACKQTTMGTEITNTAMMMALLCRDLILRDGLAAYQSAVQNIVTPQLENVIEANCFLSGAGGANTGCAAAHGIGDYLCRLPEGHAFMHGERVFVGLIVQLILEQYPEEEIHKVLRFGRNLELPLCIRDLGVKNTKECADELAEGLQEDHFMANLSCDHSRPVLAGAFLYAQYLADNL